MSSLRTGRNKWKTNQIHSPENIEMISSNEDKDCETDKRQGRYRKNDL